MIYIRWIIFLAILNFNFIHNLSSNPHDEDDNSFDFFNVDELSSPYSSSNFNCRYLDIPDSCTILSNDDRISILSLNIQSLSAKFAEFNELINIFSEKNCLPDVILLQEI
jgi:hypothetical protein